MDAGCIVDEDGVGFSEGVKVLKVDSGKLDTKVDDCSDMVGGVPESIIVEEDVTSEVLAGCPGSVEDVTGIMMLVTRVSDVASEEGMSLTEEVLIDTLVAICPVGADSSGDGIGVVFSIFEEVGPLFPLDPDSLGVSIGLLDMVGAAEKLVPTSVVAGGIPELTARLDVLETSTALELSSIAELVGN